MSNSRTFISVAPYWDILHRYRRTAVSIFVVGAIVTAVVQVLFPRTYTSSVLLEDKSPEVQANTVDGEEKEAAAPNLG